MILQKPTPRLLSPPLFGASTCAILLFHGSKSSLDELNDGSDDLRAAFETTDKRNKKLK
jgi:hypothetical protein